MSTEIERLIVRLVGDAASYESAMNKALADAQRTSAGIEKEISSIKTSVAGLEQVAKKVGSGLQSLGGSIAGFGAMWSVGITAPITGFLGASVAAATKMQSLQLAVNAVAGSAGEAEKQLAALREVAKLPGLGLEEAIQGSVRLQAAGLSAKDAERALMGFGNALATVGKGRAQLDMVLAQLTQVASGEFLQGDEIRSIADQVPQLRSILKDAFGTASSEALKKMGITSKQAIEEMIKGLEKLPKVAGGVANTFENLKDTAFQAMVKVGNVVLEFVVPVMEKGAAMIEKFADWFGKLDPTIQKTIIVVAALAAGVGPLLAALGGAVMATGAFVAAIGTIGLPVVAGIAAVVAAIGGITVAVAAAVYAIVGPDGIASAFQSVVKFAREAFDQINGFMINWKHNSEEISSWFKENWLEILLNVAAAGITAFQNMNDNMIIGVVNALALGAQLFQNFAMTVGWTIAELGKSIKEIIGDAIVASLTGKEFDISPAIKKLQTGLENGAKAGMATTQAVVENFKAPLAFKGLLDGFETSLDEWPDLITRKLGEVSASAGLQKVSKDIAEAVFTPPPDKGAEALMAKYRTPVEKLRQELADLQKYQEMGMFKDAPETFKRGVNAIKKELDTLAKKSVIDLKFNYQGVGAGTWEDIMQIEEQINRISNMKVDKEAAAQAEEAKKFQKEIEQNSSLGGVSNETFAAFMKGEGVGALGQSQALAAVGSGVGPLTVKQEEVVSEQKETNKLLTEISRSVKRGVTIKVASLTT